MNANPLVSVIIPTYERVSLTLEAVESALAQEYENLEVIVVDDGSSDEITKQLAVRLPAEVTFIRLDHSGLPAIARNAGVEVSRGDWIAFLDSDDIWTTNKISKQISLAMSGGYDCVSTNFDMSKTGSFSNEPGQSPTELTLNSMLDRNIVVNSSVVVRKSCLVSIGGVVPSHNVRGVEDYATWLRLLSKYSWVHIHENLGIYTTENSEAERLSTQSDPFNHVYAIINFLGWQRLQKKRLIFPRVALKILVLSLKRRY